MTYNVAALYVATSGHYPKLAAEWFDEKRDARGYGGSLPVVAHPPCAPWSRWCSGLIGERSKALAPLALTAVEQVRKWGGVLEHPAYSKLWEAAGLPYPGEFPDEFGGRTYQISQKAWGHKSFKLTWLYAVRLPAPNFMDQPWERPAGCWNKLSAHQRIATPEPLARELCAWAERAS